MADVKWIKIATSIFDNRKIRQIETLPDGDSIIVIWFKLLCLAGNTNDKGFIYFTSEIPYTEQMLATQFNRPLTTVQLALRTFEQFGMVEIIEDIIKVSSWEKYQNVDGMEKIREQNRIRQKKWYDKQKALPNVRSNVTITQPNATDIEEEIDKDKEKDKKKIRHKYGEYNNVLLTDQELDKLKDEFPDWQQRIENLSSYVASTGKSYKSHYATIRNWARKDNPKKQETPKYNWDGIADSKPTNSGNTDYF